MGYILPYTSYQDLQYRSRENRDQYTSRYTLPISPLRPISSNDPSHQQALKSKSNHKININEPYAEKVYSQMTGKGQHYNVLI